MLKIKALLCLVYVVYVITEKIFRNSEQCKELVPQTLPHLFAYSFPFSIHLIQKKLTCSNCEYHDGNELWDVMNLITRK